MSLFLSVEIPQLKNDTLIQWYIFIFVQLLASPNFFQTIPVNYIVVDIFNSLHFLSYNAY